MNLNSTETHESQAFPGVTFTVKVLNRIQRAKRDAEIAEARLEVSELSGRALKLAAFPSAALDLLGKLQNDSPESNGFDATKEKLADMIRAMERPEEADKLLIRAEFLQDQHLNAAAIKHGLVEVSGLMIDGEPCSTPRDVVLKAPDDLIAEIVMACANASGLSEADRKNLQSLGTLEGSAAGPSESTTVTNANAESSTGSETAESTSPVT